MVQTPVERFNYEINMRCLVPFRMLLTVMEDDGVRICKCAAALLALSACAPTRWQVLDHTVPLHVFAFSFLAKPILQHSLDLLEGAWNNHYRRAPRGAPGTGGRPIARALERPHPGGQLHLPPGFDGVSLYHGVSGDSPDVDDARDPLLGQPAAQHMRLAHVVQTLGPSAQPVWKDLVAGVYSPFICAYCDFLYDS